MPIVDIPSLAPSTGRNAAACQEVQSVSTILGRIACGQDVMRGPANAAERLVPFSRACKGTKRRGWRFPNESASALKPFTRRALAGPALQIMEAGLAHCAFVQIGCRSHGRCNCMNTSESRWPEACPEPRPVACVAG